MPQQKAGAKAGRWKRNPSNVKYKESNRWEKNKIKRIVNDLFRRVCLVCRKAKNDKWRNQTNRQMLKKVIYNEVYVAVKENKQNKFNNSYVENWANQLA